MRDQHALELRRIRLQHQKDEEDARLLTMRLQEEQAQALQSAAAAAGASAGLSRNNVILNTTQLIAGLSPASVGAVGAGLLAARHLLPERPVAAPPRLEPPPSPVVPHGPHGITRQLLPALDALYNNSPRPGISDPEYTSHTPSHQISHSGVTDREVTHRPVQRDSFLYGRPSAVELDSIATLLNSRLAVKVKPAPFARDPSATPKSGASPLKLVFGSPGLNRSASAHS